MSAIDTLLKKIGASISDREKESLAKELAENKVKIRNFELVGKALEAEPEENEYINEFALLIENDFKKELCNKERGANDAENLSKLDHVLKEMKLIANCPELYSKTVGAVGGGFSSGKSSFINSFFTDSRIKLADGIKPVTVIPSYVICDKDTAIQGISFRGGVFGIETEIYKEISREFVKSFSFDLKKIINYTTVLTPMEDKYFKNLCLIDTPGYNPPGSRNTAHDFETARKYIKDTAFLIWIVGLDATGTIPTSDIDFLNNLEFGIHQNKPLYIVANKAELKTKNDTKNDIENILDKFEETLKDYDFSYAGITAYNSMKKEIHASRKKDIYEFLAGHNNPSKKYMELKGILHDVFKQYFETIHDDHNEKDPRRREIHKTLIETLKNEETNKNVEELLISLKQYFEAGESLENRMQRVGIIREKFMDCLDNFCKKMGIERKELRFCKKCGKPSEDKKSVFCKNCGGRLS